MLVFYNTTLHSLAITVILYSLATVVVSCSLALVIILCDWLCCETFQIGLRVYSSDKEIISERIKDEIDQEIKQILKVSFP